MHLRHIQLRRLSLPLRTPYKLAFGPVTRLDTVLVHIHDPEGASGVGEATILTGYTPETIDGCWRDACAIAEEICGEDDEAAESLASAHHARAPFTVTAIVTAIEMARGSPHLKVPPGRVPLQAVVDGADEAALAAEIEARISEGYGTLKLKAGFDWERDVAWAAFARDQVAGRAKLRIDANQGFNAANAVKYIQMLDPRGIELFEQPCDQADWAAAELVADAAFERGLPLMLDESIYGAAEIERAAELRGVTHVKLKLMKAGSLKALAGQLTLIRQLGMTPVLGNGVASDIGCWMEGCIASLLIDNAGEMNGFLKPASSPVRRRLVAEGGSLVLPETPPDLAGDDALAPLTVAEASFGTPP